MNVKGENMSEDTGIFLFLQNRDAKLQHEQKI